MSLELPDLTCTCDQYYAAAVPSVVSSVDQVQTQPNPVQANPVQLYYQPQNQCSDGDLYQLLMNKYYSLSKNQRYALIAASLYLGYRILR
jgi:hypothetical protein